MASLLSQLASLIVGPTKPVVARPPKPPAAKPKSPERLAMEQSILADRRRILANMAAMQKEREAKNLAHGIPDKDTMSAAEIARRILLDQGGH
ncbi:MAG TPA: hypothetical protein VGV37_28800 [Aliidongia sp.]|uniref:hypothetical protein n=1 Tax=Aliidongia sp. TaxID=1914230 RepID=UPI002DDDB79E|nr:hypothetical protein [Aliidongia sp.]HEV2678560.1 hypothetical protein [Aliidongia sp.]